MASIFDVGEDGVLTAEIRLTQNKVAFVDATDLRSVSKYRWYLHRAKSENSSTWYATTRFKMSNGKRVTMSLHRFLLGLDVGETIDHKDGNGLNCKRSNLRPATSSQNSQNRRKTHGTSIYKGVHLDRRDGRWVAQIMLDYRTTRLGFFSIESDAPHAHAAAARDLFGPFATFNFPLPGERRA